MSLSVPEQTPGSIFDIERRQDEVLRALGELEQRITTLLAEYGGEVMAPVKNAA